MAYDQSKRRALYVLRFDEDTELAGLEVACRKPGYRATRLLQSAVLALGDDLTGTGLAGDALMAAWLPLFTALQRSVCRWNLIDNGRSVPVSGLLDQDIPFLLMLARTWYEQVVRHQPGIDESEEDDQKVPSGKTTVDSHAPRPSAFDNEFDGEPWRSGPGGSMVSPVTGAKGIDEEWLAQLPAREILPDAPEPGDDIAVPAGPVLAGAEA